MPSGWYGYPSYDPCIAWDRLWATITATRINSLKMDVLPCFISFGSPLGISWKLCSSPTLYTCDLSLHRTRAYWCSAVSQSTCVFVEGRETISRGVKTPQTYCNPLRTGVESTGTWQHLFGSFLLCCLHIQYPLLLWFIAATVFRINVTTPARWQATRSINFDAVWVKCHLPIHNLLIGRLLPNWAGLLKAISPWLSVD